MNFMLLYLAVCTVIGLKSSTRVRRTTQIFMLTVALIAFFLFFPNRL